MPFQCVIVTPEKQVMDEAVQQVILPAHDGLMGILTDRAPLLVKLGAGLLRVDGQGGPSRRFALEGGVAQMKDNRLTILTQMVIPADQIDSAAARTELEQAKALKIGDAGSVERRQRAIARAQAKVNVALQH